MFPKITLRWLPFVCLLCLTCLLCSDCFLNIAKWEETPVWMLCCWSVSLVGDRLWKLILEDRGNFDRFQKFILQDCGNFDWFRKLILQDRGNFGQKCDFKTFHEGREKPLEGVPDNQEGGCSEEEPLPLHRILFFRFQDENPQQHANLTTLIWILFIVELPTLMGEKWRAASRWIGVCCLIGT